MEEQDIYKSFLIVLKLGSLRFSSTKEYVLLDDPKNKVMIISITRFVLVNIHYFFIFYSQLKMYVLRIVSVQWELSQIKE